MTNGIKYATKLCKLGKLYGMEIEHEIDYFLEVQEN